jgi:hypothetical protein
MTGRPIEGASTIVPRPSVIRNDGPRIACAAVAPRATTSWGRTMASSSSSQGRQARTSAAFGFS